MHARAPNAPSSAPSGGLALLHEIEDDVRELDAALGSGDHVDGAMHSGALRDLERRDDNYKGDQRSRDADYRTNFRYNSDEYEYDDDG